MAFRVIVSEGPDLTTIRSAGRLGDDAVTLLSDACGHARRPLILDLSDLTSSSDAGVLLLRRLRTEGVRLQGVSQYLRLLLDHPVATDVAATLPASPRPPRRRATRPGPAARRRAEPSR